MCPECLAPSFWPSLLVFLHVLKPKMQPSGDASGKLEVYGHWGTAKKDQEEAAQSFLHCPPPPFTYDDLEGHNWVPMPCQRLCGVLRGFQGFSGDPMLVTWGGGASHAFLVFLQILAVRLCFVSRFSPMAIC